MRHWGKKTIGFYDVFSPPQKQKQRKNVWLRQDKSKCQREANTNLAIPSREFCKIATLI